AARLADDCPGDRRRTHRHTCRRARVATRAGRHLSPGCRGPDSRSGHRHAFPGGSVEDREPTSCEVFVQSLVRGADLLMPTRWTAFNPELKRDSEEGLNREAVVECRWSGAVAANVLAWGGCRTGTSAPRIDDTGLSRRHADGHAAAPGGRRDEHGHSATVLLPRAGGARLRTDAISRKAERIPQPDDRLLRRQSSGRDGRTRGGEVLPHRDAAP